MISRHWKAVAKPGKEDHYLEHLRKHTLPDLGKIAGFVRAFVLTRPLALGTEIQVVTVWESIDAIHAFAGADAEVAVVPHAVEKLMASFDKRVVHYDVVEGACEP